MSDHLHIVCLDAPSPPDYGGAIDMFYKVKALGAIGKKIHLHYFDYRASRNAEGLETDCVSIHVYKRKPFYKALPLSRPFIVQSRINNELINRLNEDDQPVLLEGLHCAGIIPFINRPARIVLRMHNDEASYYRHLANTEPSLFKRIYFKRESALLHSYQKNIDKSIKLACLSETDTEIFEEGYGFRTVAFVSCFLPWQTLNIQPGSGSYCLYHGKLSVSENEGAALWLIENVFSKTNAPFVIAGTGISTRLATAAKAFDNITLIDNPTIAKIDDLIQHAHINVLPSMNATGVKLKLLNALLNGRHCITNKAGLKGSGIESGLVVEDDADKWRRQIDTLMPQDFSASQTGERRLVLENYNNHKNAEKLSALW